VVEKQTGPVLNRERIEAKGPWRVKPKSADGRRRLLSVHRIHVGLQCLWFLRREDCSEAASAPRRAARLSAVPVPQTVAGKPELWLLKFIVTRPIYWPTCWFS